MLGRFKMNSLPPSPTSWQANKNDIRWLNVGIKKKADIMINCNEVKQLADSLVNLPPDDLYEDPGNASSLLVSWQPLVHTLNITSHSLIGSLETHFLAIKTENIFFLCVREHGLFVMYSSTWLMLMNYHWLICRQGWISDIKSHTVASVLLNFVRLWFKVSCRCSNSHSARNSATAAIFSLLYVFSDVHSLEILRLNLID